MKDKPIQIEHERKYSSLLGRMICGAIKYKFDTRREMGEDEEYLWGKFGEGLLYLGDKLDRPILRKVASYTCYALPLISGIGVGLAADTTENAWMNGITQVLVSAPAGIIAGFVASPDSPRKRRILSLLDDVD